MSKVSDFYDDPADFDADLDRAAYAAVTERENEFVSGLRGKFEEWGAKDVSERQPARLAASHHR